MWGILVRNPHCRFSLPDFDFFRSFRIHKKLYLRLTKKLQSIVSLSYGRALIKRKLIGYEIFQTKDKQTHSLEQTERTLDFRPDIPQSLQL